MTNVHVSKKIGGISALFRAKRLDLMGFSGRFAELSLSAAKLVPKLLPTG